VKLKPLYHKGKTGKIVEWKIWTKGDEIHVQWGQVDGAFQHTMTKATAKNVGKKNEIKAEAQADIEAKAMWKHRVDRKYSETIKEAEETVFLPMLAHPWDKKKHTVKYPVDVQPKLDGNRALAYWEGDKVVLMSRGGKTWDIKHIQDAIAEILPKGMILDGEIYKHGLNLQGINKLVKKHRPGPDGSESLKFYAFDYFDPEAEDPWWKRNQAMQTDIKPNGTVVLVQSSIISDEKGILKVCADCVEEGYEGVIVRTRDGLYTLGERSSDLLKVKMFQDDEFEIVNHYEGQGRHEGYVGFVCKTKDGKEFRCYPRGNDTQRREYGKKPKSYYGQKLTVRFQFLTDEGVPFLPIGICIRDPRDQPI
jgi:ATP-dependent DNA ligase